MTGSQGLMGKPQSSSGRRPLVQYQAMAIGPGAVQDGDFPPGRVAHRIPHESGSALTCATKACPPPGPLPNAAVLLIWRPPGGHPIPARTNGRGRSPRSGFSGGHVQKLRVAGEDRVMGSVPGRLAAEAPQEWLALPGGRIRPVVSVPGDDGVTELLAHAAWLARLQPACRCGRPRLGSGRTCGSAECVAGLHEQDAGRQPDEPAGDRGLRRQAGPPQHRA
jgi:hypothetical protein